MQSIDEESLRSKVFQAIGQASMCWQHPENAGEFLSTAAMVIGEALMKDIKDAWLLASSQEIQRLASYLAAQHPEAIQIRNADESVGAVDVAIRFLEAHRLASGSAKAPAIGIDLESPPFHPVKGYIPDQG